MHNANQGRQCALLGLALVSITLGGCVSGSSKDNDPLEGLNRGLYNFNDGLDKHFVRPVAQTYAKITPVGVRTGITNFFDNLGYLNVIANDILQGKLKQAAQDTARVFINSTVGIGGLYDAATPSGFPAHDEDLGQTLGTWGFGEGAYLVLPLRGPNSLRDAPDIVSSALLSPLYYLSAPITIPLGALSAINERANYLDATRIRDEQALDPYSFTREAYRQTREYKIYDGNPPNKVDKEYLDEGEGGVLKVY